MGKGGRKRGRETSVCERNINRLPLPPPAPLTPPTGGLAYNPDMCSDWELNQRPFSLWEDAHPTEPHQSGLSSCFYISKFYLPQDLFL